MPASIGVNLRVTGNCRQGGRKYMEDFFSVAYQQTEDEKDLEYAFFGIFDGHGGSEAASFAKEHLMETIIQQKNFWSDDDADVLKAIKDGYIATHYAMWREQWKWPKTSSGLPSTAGTTASIAFIRRGKIYMGHVGDSGIILGYQVPDSNDWKAKSLTKDHKPECEAEMNRIISTGGKVVSKAGVPRVVWNRPKAGHVGPVRRSTPIDEIPFLAVARSLGDLWSYNSQLDRFIVSPCPDCSVLPIDANIHRCLVFGTDGLLNMLSANAIVHIVQQAERRNESAALGEGTNKVWLNPSKLLVSKALEKWQTTKMRADNTSVVTLMLDPPGPPRAQVLKDRKKNLPETGLKILTRYDENAANGNEIKCKSTNISKTTNKEDDLMANEKNTVKPVVPNQDETNVTMLKESIMETSNSKNESNQMENVENREIADQSQDKNSPEVQQQQLKKLSSLALEILEKTNSPAATDEFHISTNSPSKDDKEFEQRPNESTSFEPKPLTEWHQCVVNSIVQISNDENEKNIKNHHQPQQQQDDRIQINEISSSTISEDVNRLVSANKKIGNISDENDLKKKTVQVQNNELEPTNNKTITDQTQTVKRKRKTRYYGDVASRKSSRININQKSPNAGDTQAEEKLKQGPEKIEEVSKKVGNEQVATSSVNTVESGSLLRRSVRTIQNGNINKSTLKQKSVIDTQKLKIVLHNIFPNLNNRGNKVLDNVNIPKPQPVNKSNDKSCKESSLVGQKSNKATHDAVKRQTKDDDKNVSDKLESKKSHNKADKPIKRRKKPVRITMKKKMHSNKLVSKVLLNGKAKRTKNVDLPVTRSTRSTTMKSKENAVGRTDNNNVGTKENVMPKGSTKEKKKPTEKKSIGKESTTPQGKVKEKNQVLKKSRKNK